MTTGLATFFKQNLWANLLLLDTCANLVDAQLDLTTKGMYGSVRETLIHIFAAEERYVQRFTGQRNTPQHYEGNPFPGFDALRQGARKTGEELIAIAEQWEESQILQVSYEGHVYEIPAIFVLIQVINHGTDHRSQIATLLSQQGITLPELDGWSYYAAMK